MEDRIATAREMEAWALLASGLEDSEIGARMFVSTRTASYHINNLRNKVAPKASRVKMALLYWQKVCGIEFPGVAA